MKNLYETLREKERLLAQVQREIDALRLAAKLLVDDNEKSSAPAADAATPSQPMMIRDVLLDYGKPLHVTDIARAIKRKFNVKLKPLYVTAIIYRAIKGEKFFRKEGANTFGLLEWPATQQGIDEGDKLKLAS